MNATEQNPTVLLVDDNPQTLASTSSCLRANGMKVIAIASPFDATGIVQNQKPDAIILDVMMPGLNGAHLGTLIRKESDAPIIYFSAIPEEELRNLASRTPNAWYVLKSEGLIYLNEVIERRFRQMQPIEPKRMNSP